MANDDDCDDANPAVHPNAIEICGDSIDNNCNGEQDEAAACAEANPTLCAASGGTWIGLPADGACCGNVDQEYFVQWPRLAEPEDVSYPTGCWNSQAIDNNALVSRSLLSTDEAAWEYEEDTYFEIRNDGARDDVAILSIGSIGTQATAMHRLTLEPNAEYQFRVRTKTRNAATAEISLLTFSAAEGVIQDRDVLLSIPANTDWTTQSMQFETESGEHYGIEFSVSVPEGDLNSGVYFDDFELYHTPSAQVINWAGQYYGCMLTDAATIGRDDTNRPGSQRIVDTNAEYCTVEGDWFCGYQDQWEEGQRDQVSDAPPGAAALAEEDFIQTQCCTEAQCWTGSECVDSVDLETNPDVEPTMVGDQAYVCVDSAWQTAAPKENQDGTETGYCAAAQCFFSRLGENPRCVNDRFWAADDYCDNGQWTSRTRMVALQLIQLAGSGDYTVYCDTPTNAANRLAYFIPPESPAWKFLFGDNSPDMGYFLCGELPEDQPCANHLCVMRWEEGEKVALGLALNEPIDRSFDYSVLNLFPEARQSTSPGYFDYCDAAIAKGNEEGGYWGCKGRTAAMQNTNANIWYHSELQSVIFSEQGVRIGATGLQQLFQNVLQGPFQWIANFVRNLFAARNQDSAFSIGDYRTVYLNRAGDREIKAVEEEHAAETLTTVNYYQYSMNVCAAVQEYCARNPSTAECFGISCQPTIKDGEIVFNIQAKNIPASSDLWRGLTAAVRTGDPNTIDGEVLFSPLLAIEPNIRDIVLNTPFTVGISNAANAPSGIIGYVWDFGDGTTLSSTDPEERLAHRFTQSGNYRIRLRTIDEFLNIHEGPSAVVRV